MTEHGLVMAYFPDGRMDDPLFRCACWAVASGVRKGIWTVATAPDGTVGFSPSVNWPGHFHDFYSGIPLARSMQELFVNPAWVATA
jgi:hypothetical protein